MTMSKVLQDRSAINKISKLSLAIFLCLFSFHQVKAQSEEASDNTSDVDQIEAEVENKVRKEAYPEVVPEREPPIENFAGLGKIAPFSEVSVIQRRFLPKTGRFQFFGGVANIVNDPWFFGIGMNAKLAYHLTETWSLEGTGIFIQNSERTAAKELQSNHRVQTSSIVTMKGYTGASLVWTPIYGKLSYGNRRILPFDMYFSVGGGATSVDGGSAGSTLSFGTGQVYALSKAMAFRWDFAWNNFSATPTGASSQSFNSLLLTAGLSFFFPEAKYR